MQIRRNLFMNPVFVTVVATMNFDNLYSSNKICSEYYLPTMFKIKPYNQDMF